MKAYRSKKPKSKMREPWEEITGSEVRELEEFCGEFTARKIKSAGFYESIAEELDWIRASFSSGSRFHGSMATLPKVKNYTATLSKKVRPVQTLLKDNEGLFASIFCGHLGNNIGGIEGVRKIKAPILPGHSTTKNLDTLPEYRVVGEMGLNNILEAVRQLDEACQKAAKDFERMTAHKFDRSFGQNKGAQLYRRLRPVHNKLYEAVRISRKGTYAGGPSVRFFLYLFERTGLKMTPESFARMVERKGK